jgi:uncharacterized protein (DUF983 family)
MIIVGYVRCPECLGAGFTYRGPLGLLPRCRRCPIDTTHPRESLGTGRLPIDLIAGVIG